MPHRSTGLQVTHTLLRLVVICCNIVSETEMSLQPLDAISDRAKTDGTSVSSWTFSDDAGLSKDTAAGKDVALVFITADSGYVFCTFLPLG